MRFYEIFGAVCDYLGVLVRFIFVIIAVIKIFAICIVLPIYLFSTNHPVAILMSIVLIAAVILLAVSKFTHRGGI
ncbi:hypothetical protein [Natranaerobius thermophilus]|uniref:Uncharacterized protein n=1 Tax=Natranaerobius thermophilus (strain ATCC BAA-1301 / DSM 18059 / JW/NM-WN-LF) TaxID=457570 RepID=B2A115_NATTJ|nr:hypothetical protein [Natranaerobius thermophilus]ACB84638.1 hypothetical protein Nther_1054 [Natranaerobius thermophilus JW/NM-WN-LF]